MWTTITSPISELQENEVFVFGSNRGRKNPQGLRQSPDGGFHGAGAASVAFRGHAGHADHRHPLHWSNDPHFLAAMQAPVGDPARVGRWAVYGICTGPMQGTCGKSYAIYTTVAPGLRRSVPLPEIQRQMQGMLDYAAQRPHLTWLVTPLGEGYAGYSRAEMDAQWQALTPFPNNVRFLRFKAGTP